MAFSGVPLHKSCIGLTQISISLDPFHLSFPFFSLFFFSPPLPSTPRLFRTALPERTQIQYYVACVPWRLVDSRFRGLVVVTQI